jgi:hypothetical protein
MDADISFFAKTLSFFVTDFRAASRKGGRPRSRRVERVASLLEQ